MRLKSIKLAGFKSFVDPTTALFPTNRTAVIGPNGCGKSNVIDAVRWVMGESSARLLRGESMADVIFNGSTARKPVSQASIELIFDNSDVSLGGAYASYNEISVRRLVNRDGRSDYFLNGARCRRKDITDLFLGTGLGPRSYAIIEQGMISRLIEAKPEELRVYLEEAAGISRYKDRRRETETRMRHTRENMDRLQDIRQELERQLQHLEKQAQSAEKYRILKDEELQIRAELLVLRWRLLERERSQLEKSQNDMTGHIELQRVEVEEAEQRLTLMAEQRSILALQHQQIAEEFYRLGSDVDRLQQSIQHHEQRSKDLGRSLLEAEQECLQLQAVDGTDVAEEARCKAQLGALLPELAIAQERMEDIQQQVLIMDEQWQSKQKQLEHAQAQERIYRQQAEVQQTRLKQLEQAMKRSSERLERLAQEHGLMLEAEPEEELLLLRDRLEDIHQRQLQGEDQSRLIQQHIVEARQELSVGQKALDELRTGLRQLEGERASLETLQRDALAISHLQTAALTESMPAVAAQLHVDDPWVRSVEAVLGRRLQARWLEPDRWDQIPLDQAKTQGWVVLTEWIKQQEWEEDALVHKVHPKSVHPWLAGARCASSLEEAMARRSELVPGAFWVTADGVMVGPNWQQWPDRQQPGQGVLERQRRLDAKVVEIEQLRMLMADQEERVRIAREAVLEKEQGLEDHRHQQNELSRQRALLMADHSARQARREQILARRQRLDQEMAEVGQHRQHDEDEYRQTREALAMALESLNDYGTEVEKALAERDACSLARDQIRAQLSAQHMVLQNMQLEERQWSTRLQGIQVTRERTNTRLLASRQRLDQIQQSLEEHRQLIVPGAVDVQQVLQLRQAAEQTMQERSDAMHVLEASLRQTTQARHVLQQKLDERRTELATIDIRIQDAVSRQQVLLEQLREQGVQLEQVLARLADDAEDTVWAERLDNVQKRIARLGAINLAAIEEYKAQQERKIYLDDQYADLEEALQTLEQAIRKIDRETRSLFKETFEKVNDGFKALFPKVFGGGEAWLELDGEDLLEAGVTIMARPPGKRNSTIHLLSGGEKALTALSLVFSIFALNPAPFCMLDEVDAPLDDANVGRFARLVEEMAEQVQFIFITHNKIAMEMAEQLIGVTMHEPGVSRLVSVNLEEAARMAAV